MEEIKDSRKTIKIIFIVLGIVLGLFSVLVFSGKIPGLENETTVTDNIKLNMVGTIPDVYINKAIDNYNIKYGKTFGVEYTYIPEDKLSEGLIKYAAGGYSPDLILANADTLVANKSLLRPVGYSDPGALSEIEYKQTFIDGADIWSNGSAYLFYPALTDPLMTYYNKKLLRSENITKPMSNWKELSYYQSKLTKYDETNKLYQSAFAVGGENVINNKDLFLLSLMQSVGKIVINNYFINQDGALVNNYGFNLGNNPDSNGGASILYRILSMHNAFTDPDKTSFTWNVDDVTDYQSFIDNKLVFYFGKASDYNKIVAVRPDLDLGIAFIPQLYENYSQYIYTGDMYGIAISKSTPNYNKAISVANILSGQDISGFVSTALGISSARKDTLAGFGNQERVAIIGTSALNSQFLFNINKIKINQLISSIYKSIYTGKWTIDQGVDYFVNEFTKIYNPDNGN